MNLSLQDSVRKLLPLFLSCFSKRGVEDALGSVEDKIACPTGELPPVYRHRVRDKLLLCFRDRDA